jgi:hypothetical protein
MLLVSFHGATGGIQNVYAYSTATSNPGTLLNSQALSGAPELIQLRDLAFYKGNLYVTLGSGSEGAVLVFSGPQTGTVFNFIDQVIGSSQSIFHPFSVAFDPSSSNCYVSNQNSNIVAQVALTAQNGKVTGTLPSGCQSSYLSNLYPSPNNAFLDGTFVASQIGELDEITLPNIPNVPAINGGLGVSPSTGGKKGKPIKPTNSVRDVEITNGMLFVCDEVDGRVNVYNLSNGQFLAVGFTRFGSSGDSPSHLAIYQNGLWVSAGTNLYWAPAPANPPGASIAFQSVAISVPAQNKIGGISFDSSGNIYVIFQQGTGGTGQGSIYKATVTAGVGGAPPTLSNGSNFATIPAAAGDPADTPEFCLWLPDAS